MPHHVGPFAILFGLSACMAPIVDPLDPLEPYIIYSQSLILTPFIH